MATLQMLTSDYTAFFKRVTGVRPHGWQDELGSVAECRDRLVRIPTGFGKTAGVVLPWLYHRVLRADPAWPTRLVFCLPMRVLVEQTEAAIRAWVAAAGASPAPDVHVLMGGVEASRWILEIDRPAVLVGTQDMLLSRALNRGYGSARAAWPMEFGQLHHDALWVVDEVQILDVGLATTTQLAAFRVADTAAGKCGSLRPAHTWWMSATLQPSWLATVDHATRTPGLKAEMLRIPAEARSGGLWDVVKSLRRGAHEDRTPAKKASKAAEGAAVKKSLATAAEIAALVRDHHQPKTLTLVIVNTVKRSREVFEALAALSSAPISKGKRKDAPNAPEPALRLVHSRFRGAERRFWSADFLSRGALIPERGRIVVATQVVEAGVDVSARLLVTDLAPWPSLVQRFGRAARYEGESAEIFVVGQAVEGKDARPYEPEALESAARALDELITSGKGAAPRDLDRFEEGLDDDAVKKLYPYEPLHVLRRRDLDQLFDTSTDLGGGDVDVSRFIRSGDERDVTVFWRELPKDAAAPPSKTPSPRRDELCPVPLGELREWAGKAPKGRRRRVFRFEYLEGEWRSVDFERLAPGAQLFIATDEGGYSTTLGWDPASSDAVSPVAPTDTTSSPPEAKLSEASATEDNDDLSAGDEWKTIATHGREAGQQARAIGVSLGLDAALIALLDLAGRWHDAGKAHVVFQAAIAESARVLAGEIGQSRELAKAPNGAWRRPPYPKRPGFRHELASTLTLFELLRRYDAGHAALLGPHLELFVAMGQVSQPVEAGHLLPPGHELGKEVASLDAAAFDLLAWLVCTHHGKVRCVMASTIKDQESGEDRIHGVQRGDTMPQLSLATADGGSQAVPALELSLTLAELGVGTRFGASWGERVAGLLGRHGPFALAYLEAVLRVADVRATILGGVP